jgi:transcriptional regulator with XRE-family HTH domain
MSWELTASQFLRAIRAKRSQAAFSRRLGYSSNVACDWEAGRRAPTAAQTLAHCRRLGLPVQAAFQAFQPACANTLLRGKEFTVGAWLDALRGSTSMVVLAQRTGFSRHAVARWLSGRAEPRLPAFLHLVEAITGRVSDLVQGLVPIEQVPELLAAHQRRAAAKRLALDYPWTEAVLRVVETASYQSAAKHQPGYIARRLGITQAREAEALERLEKAGILTLRDGRYGDVQPLTVDTSASPEELGKLKSHWTNVCLQRLTAPLAEDWLGYNVLSISEGDIERIRDVLRRAFREVRAIAANSEPVETVALLNLQLITWPEPSAPPTDEQ